MKNEDQPNFEEALARLESIVKELEDESISLEKSINLYEEGIKLSRICTQTLEEAELRIEKVSMQQDDNTSEE